jgi:hypothetical protein
MSSSTRSLRRIADHQVRQALDAAFNQTFATAVAADPKGTWRAGTAVRAYLRAVRARLAWLGPARTCSSRTGVPPSGRRSRLLRLCKAAVLIPGDCVRYRTDRVPRL